MIATLPAAILFLAFLCVAWYVVAGNFIYETKNTKTKRK
jgi:hypothetical protein